MQGMEESGMGRAGVWWVQAGNSLPLVLGFVRTSQHPSAEFHLQQKNPFVENSTWRLNLKLLGLRF